MTKYYKATFENGRVETRSTATRTYTHAYLATGTFACAPGATDAARMQTWESKGWGGTHHRAASALASQVSYACVSGRRDLTFSGIAEAVEITGAEYRALKAEARAPKQAQEERDDTDPENIYGLASIRQSIEEDRK